MTAPIVTRFAPSPTGLLHLGHAFAAMLAHGVARAGGGRFLVRIEDIDAARVRPAFEQAIAEDLDWLGLATDAPFIRQSEHLAAHEALLARLAAQGLTYPCFCTRAEIAQEIASSAAAPQGPEGPHYPGTCRRLSADERTHRQAAGVSFAIRLDTEEAARRLGQARTAPPDFVEHLKDAPDGPVRHRVDARLMGDVVIARKDVGTSYHLAVVADDEASRISHVTRGLDLFEATHIHRTLQALCGLGAPEYGHHGLILDDGGRRLAKRHDALSLRRLRQDGVTPRDIEERLPAVPPLVEKILATSR